VTNPKFKKICLLLIPLLFAACGGIEDINITGVDNFNLMGIEENTLTFSADIGVSNPSGVAFRVREINLAASADGIFIGNIRNRDFVKIPAHSDSTYYMVFDLELPNMLSTAGTLMSMSRKSQVNVELKGEIKSTSGLVTKKTQVSESRTVDVPRTGFF
jgi:LEA14-like dessication related protein